MYGGVYCAREIVENIRDIRNLVRLGRLHQTIIYHIAH